MQIYGPADQPYLTDDTVLAFCLYLAFVPFSDDGLPCVNTYTTKQLKALGYKGIKPLEAVEQAVKDGRKGTVNYMFKMPEGEMLAAFNEAKKLVEDGDGSVRDVIRVLMEEYKHGIRSLEETILRVTCIVIYMRPQFVKLWQGYQSLLRVDDLRVQAEEMRQHDGSRVVTYGGVKFVSPNASEEIQRRLGLC